MIPLDRCRKLLGETVSLSDQELADVRLALYSLVQIMIYMLAVYLVFKGIEIFQVALMSNRSETTFGLLIGAVCIAVAIVAGVGFSAGQLQVM